MRGGVLTVAPPRTPARDRNADASEASEPADLRAVVLRELRACPGPVTVYALLTTVNRVTGTPRYPNSIYRILNQLVNDGLAFHVVSWRGYMARSCESGATPLLLLCRSCGRGEVAGCDFTPAIQRLTRRAGFALQRTHLEMSGTCGRCRPAD